MIFITKPRPVIISIGGIWLLLILAWSNCQIKDVVTNFARYFGKKRAFRLGIYDVLIGEVHNWAQSW